MDAGSLTLLVEGILVSTIIYLFCHLSKHADSCLLLALQFPNTMGHQKTSTDNVRVTLADLQTSQ